jgi:PAS domain S-box-containing protein
MKVEIERLTRRVAELEAHLAELEQTNVVLMERVESSVDMSGSSYSLFERNILLEKFVQERTSKLEEFNSRLKGEILERMRAENALRMASEYNRSLIEASLDPLVTIGSDGRISDVNLAAEQATGLSRAELIGSDFCDYFTEPDRARAGYEQAFRNGSIHDYPLEIRHRDGRTLSVLYNASVYRDTFGSIIGVFAAARDISDRVRSEQDREKLEAQLRQSQKLETIGTLAGGIAHDFNNILVPIVAYSELLLAQAHENPSLANDLKEINTAAMRARDLVKHILTFSRRSEGERINLDLVPLIKEVIKLCAASFPSTIDVNYHINCSEKRVFVDPTQIHQVLMNLCTNSSHAIGENPGQITVKLDFCSFDDLGAQKRLSLPQGNYLKLSVLDTGCGIEPQILDRIFEPFFTTKEIGKGTGLGLSVVHGIIKSHGGDIEVLSKVGSGSTFSVFIPVSSQSESKTPDESDLCTGGTEHILFVDDEPAIIAIGQKILENFGYRVTARASSHEALQAFAAQPEKFDLVITDQTMPHLTGDQLLTELRKIKPQIPIIVMTGYSTKVTPDNFAYIGFDGFVLKPMIPSHLNRAIREVFDRTKTAIA